MNGAIPHHELSWVQRFFSGRNQLAWESIESQTAPARALAQVSPWLKKLKSGEYDGPLVLPLYQADGQVMWYAMAADDRRFAQLADEITGFVGPSYSDFRGEWARLSLEDGPESALAQRFGSRVVKFTAQRDADRPQIEAALSLYLTVLKRRPETPDRTQRPFGKIRSDFDCALLAGNSDGAATLLEELIASGRVNAEQRKCLEIRMLAGLGRSEELGRNLALIESVAEVSLPAQTLLDVVASLYETFITPLESAEDHLLVFETFKRHILKPFGALFRERKGVRHPKVLRAFLLSELTASEPNAVRCHSIVAAYPQGAEGYQLALAWCETQIQVAPQPREDPEDLWLNEARQAIADEDYETASARCFQLLPHPWAYSALIRCAAEVAAPDLTQRVLHALANAPEAILPGLSEKDRTRFNKLGGFFAGTPCSIGSGWVAWAERVLVDPVASPSVAELQEMAAKWSIDEYANDTQRCEVLANILANAGGEAERVFRDAFPVLVDFFTEGTFVSRRAFTAIFSTLVKILGWSGSLSADELEIGAQLMQALLTTGPTDEEYTESVADLQEILKANAAPAHFDWGLNLAELLVQYPAPDQGALRLRVFLDVVGILRASPHRVTLPQRNILAGLAVDYGCPALLESFPLPIAGETLASPPVPSFAGLIGIYTLTAGAGQRAKVILETMYPGAVVEINSDPVSTDRLVSLAKNADIFVFAWKSSKHQAYFCIKEARQGQDIVLPLGKGSASILSGVLDKIRGSAMPIDVSIY
jgi:hypothetical protein